MGQGSRQETLPLVEKILALCYLLCLSQVTHLQVKIGAPEWALKPELAKQEYSDVSPCIS